MYKHGISLVSHLHPHKELKKINNNTTNNNYKFKPRLSLRLLKSWSYLGLELLWSQSWFILRFGFNTADLPLYNFFSAHMLFFYFILSAFTFPSQNAFLVLFISHWPFTSTTFIWPSLKPCVSTDCIFFSCCFSSTTHCPQPLSFCIFPQFVYIVI